MDLAIILQDTRLLPSSRVSCLYCQTASLCRRSAVTSMLPRQPGNTIIVDAKCRWWSFSISSTFGSWSCNCPGVTVSLVGWGPGGRGLTTYAGRQLGPVAGPRVHWQCTLPQHPGATWGPLHSFSQACVHVNRTFMPETDRTASEILPPASWAAAICSSRSGTALT